MKNRLYRSRTNKVLAGVCGGLAEYFDVDPSAVRIVTALLIVPGGLSLWIYILAAIIIPKAPLTYSGSDPRGEYNIVDEEGNVTRVFQDEPIEEGGANSQVPRNAAVVFGLILIGIGVMVLLDRFLPYLRIPHYIQQAFFPVLLIAGGAFLVFGVSGRRK
ncbi:MAG: PspC domain-containing protein [Tissierellia bacterium]|nr:PspC domain-containing protein [Bacillota bacterium]NLL23277.1 PspC domain-containing protein [Tissierellia bacterium]